MTNFSERLTVFCFWTVIWVFDCQGKVVLKKRLMESIEIIEFSLEPTQAELELTV